VPASDLLARATATDAFRAGGMVVANDGDFTYTVVDPRRHPLVVWQRRSRRPRDYERSAEALGAAVVTNGPLMGKKLLFGRNSDREQVAVDLALFTLAGALAGWALSPRAVRGLGAVLGSVVAAPAAVWRVLSRWESCGAVASATLSVRETETFDHEGPRHAWIGRSGVDFSTYAIGQGELPVDEVVEGVGGLLRVLCDGVIPRDDPEFARLGHKCGVVAWALAPRQPTWTAAGDVTGVLVVAGATQRTALDAAQTLAALGARDAVATDLRLCVLLRAGGALHVGPPAFSRQMIQQYGLACV
jgi:hypothetical protein